jgi:hypothetical protein
MKYYLTANCYFIIRNIFSQNTFPTNPSSLPLRFSLHVFGGTQLIHPPGFYFQKIPILVVIFPEAIFLAVFVNAADG